MSLLDFCRNLFGNSAERPFGNLTYKEASAVAFDRRLHQELAALGQTNEAEEYWRRAMVIPGRDSNYATLAGLELAKRHGTSRPDDDLLDESDLWPLIGT